MTGKRFLLELPLRRDWAGIELLREAALACLATVSEDHAWREQLAMVVGELLENAVKYGDWEHPHPNAALHIEGNGHHFEVCVTHAVAANANLTGLYRAVERINEAPSADEAYVELMREVSTRTEGTGGLGLARIAAEGNCRLTVERVSERRIAIRAVARPIDETDTALAG